MLFDLLHYRLFLLISVPLELILLESSLIMSWLDHADWLPLHDNPSIGFEDGSEDCMVDK